MDLNFKSCLQEKAEVFVRPMLENAENIGWVKIGAVAHAGMTAQHPCHPTSNLVIEIPHTPSTDSGRSVLVIPYC